MRISAIVAVAQNGVIGVANGMPWRLPDDMKYFQKITDGSIVIMGRKNWDSLPEKFRPLPNRRNIVLSTDLSFRARGAEVFPSKEEVKKALWYEEHKVFAKERNVFIIGGAVIYELFKDDIDTWYVTNVIKSVYGDVSIPRYWEGWKEVSKTFHLSDAKHAYPFEFVVYHRP